MNYCLTEFWYNTNTHSTMDLTPYEMVYGIPPPCLLSYAKKTTKVEAMEQVLRSHDYILQLFKRERTSGITKNEANG